MGFGKWVACGFLSVALIFTDGCKRNTAELVPDKIVPITAETILGQPGEKLSKACCVELMSKTIPGFLGGSGNAYPIEGVTLQAIPSDPSSGLTVTPAEVVTAAGGYASFDVQLGKNFGDQYLDIVCKELPSVRQRIRFVAGVAISNNKQEVTSGETTPQPIRVRLSNADGSAITNEPVFFTLSKQPGKGGRLSQSMVQTDTNGIAEVTLKTDSEATGTYEVRAEIADAAKRLVIRPIFIHAAALNLMGLFIAVFGALAIFIFGMTLMSDGLQQVAGSKMKTALAFITRNRVTAILAGTVITSIIQSSSATTVMTVGFVNAGLLSLKQAIGVVFGANIGTTVTGQMVSLNLDNLAFPSIMLGTVMLLVCRRVVLQGIARTILGFGLLFFGMTLMSDELKSVSNFPSFVAFFQMFDCTPTTVGGYMPLKAVLGSIGIGTLVTMAVQSSSATIGLTIALANSGLLNFWTAFPIVLGDNIGTTITAILAAMNANRVAKQTALAHSLFNIIGTVIMVVLFYIPYKQIPCFFYFVDSLTSGSVFLGENLGRHVAMAHTLFNVTNVIVLTSFISTLAWLCQRIIPNNNAPDVVTKLEPHLLNTPSLALTCVINALADMTEKSWRLSIDVLRNCKCGASIAVERVKATEDEVDRMQIEIMDYLVKLTRKELTEEQAAIIPALMHCINDAERISDLAYLVARSEAFQKRSNVFSQDALNELQGLLDKADAIAHMTLDSIRSNHPIGAAKAIDILKHDIKALAQKAAQAHMERIKRGVCKPELGMAHVEIIAAINNIVRHLENIAQRTDEIVVSV